mgnify:FL=1
MKQRFFFLGCVLLVLCSPFTQRHSFQIAKVKYSGGGDWYANRTALPNLIKFCNTYLSTNIDPQDPVVELSSTDLYNYPFIYLTGHGNVVFSEKEADNLRKYFESGGCLNIDDNYGLEKYIRPQMKKVFPQL